jgi:hypothetical protein
MSSIYISHQQSLIDAFKASNFLPEVLPITHSDMIATGGAAHPSHVKLSFLAKKGAFARYYMYVPGSVISEQHHLNEQEKAAVTQWLALVEASLKEGTNNEI